MIVVELLWEMRFWFAASLDKGGRVIGLEVYVELLLVLLDLLDLHVQSLDLFCDCLIVSGFHLCWALCVWLVVGYL